MNEAVRRTSRSRSANALWLPVLGSVVFLAGCAGVQDQIARDAARSVVRPVLAEQFPGVPLEPAANCVIDNASADEILALAADAAAGRPDEGTVSTTLSILSRPETISCLATDGLPELLQSGRIGL